MSDVIASVALAVSIVSAFFAWRATKQSVRPYLNIDGAFVSQEKWLVSVRNGGLGPARIIKAVVKFNDKFEESNNDNGWEFVKKERQAFGIEFYKYEFKPGDSILPGDKIHLIKLKPKENRENIKNEMNNFILFLSKIKFKIEYESINQEIQEPARWNGSEENLPGKL